VKAAAATVLSLALLSLGAPTTALPVRRVQMRRLSGLNPAVVPSGLAIVDGHPLVMDGYSDRLLMLGAHGRPIAAWGSIGGQVGEFYHPNAIAASNGRIAILDQANGRVQVLSDAGSVERLIPISSSFSISRSIAMSPDGTVVVSDPESQTAALGLFLRPDGSRQPGAPGLSAANLYPGADVDRFERAAHFVWLTSGERGSIYAAYAIAPVVQKFDRLGRNVFTVRLSGHFARRLETFFLRYPPGENGMLKSVLGGTPADLVLKSIAVDERSGDIYVLTGLNRVYRLARNGRQLGCLQLDFGNGGGVPPGATGIAVDGNAIFAICIFRPGIYKGNISALVAGKINRVSRTQRGGD